MFTKGALHVHHDDEGTSTEANGAQVETNDTDSGHPQQQGNDRKVSPRGGNNHNSGGGSVDKHKGNNVDKHKDLDDNAAKPNATSKKSSGKGGRLTRVLSKRDDKTKRNADSMRGSMSRSGHVPVGGSSSQRHHRSASYDATADGAISPRDSDARRRQQALGMLDADGEGDGEKEGGEHDEAEGEEGEEKSKGLAKMTKKSGKFLENIFSSPKKAAIAAGVYPQHKDDKKDKSKLSRESERYDKEHNVEKDSIATHKQHEPVPPVAAATKPEVADAGVAGVAGETDASQDKTTAPASPRGHAKHHTPPAYPLPLPPTPVAEPYEPLPLPPSPPDSRPTSVPLPPASTSTIEQSSPTVQADDTLSNEPIKAPSAVEASTNPAAPAVNVSETATEEETAPPPPAPVPPPPEVRLLLVSENTGQAIKARVQALSQSPEREKLGATDASHVHGNFVEVGDRKYLPASLMSTTPKFGSVILRPMTETASPSKPHPFQFDDAGTEGFRGRKKALLKRNVKRIEDTLAQWEQEVVFAQVITIGPAPLRRRAYALACMRQILHEQPTAPEYNDVPPPRPVKKTTGSRYESLTATDRFRATTEKALWDIRGKLAFIRTEIENNRQFENISALMHRVQQEINQCNVSEVGSIPMTAASDESSASTDLPPLLMPSHTTLSPRASLSPRSFTIAESSQEIPIQPITPLSERSRRGSTGDLNDLRTPIFSEEPTVGDNPTPTEVPKQVSQTMRRHARGGRKSDAGISEIPHRRKPKRPVPKPPGAQAAQPTEPTSNTEATPTDNGTGGAETVVDDKAKTAAELPANDTKPEKTAEHSAEKQEKQDKHEKHDKPEKQDKHEKHEKSDKHDKHEKPDKHDKQEKQEKHDKQEKQDKPKQDKHDKHDKQEKSDKQEKDLSDIGVIASTPIPLSEEGVVSVTISGDDSAPASGLQHTSSFTNSPSPSPSVPRFFGGSDKLRKRGYLHKLAGGRLLVRKKRQWYGFMGNNLVWWETQEVNEELVPPSGEIDLSQCSAKEAKIGQHDCVFCILTAKKTIYLQAVTRNDMMAWLKEIQDIKAAYAGDDDKNSPPNSPSVSNPDSPLNRSASYAPGSPSLLGNSAAGPLLTKSTTVSDSGQVSGSLQLMVKAHILSAKWQRRWFVIEDGFLTIFAKKKQDTTFAGPPVDLLFCSVKDVHYPGKKFCFEIVRRDEPSLYLSADTAEDMWIWISGLRDAITALRNKAMTEVQDGTQAPQPAATPAEPSQMLKTSTTGAFSSVMKFRKDKDNKDKDHQPEKKLEGYGDQRTSDVRFIVDDDDEGSEILDETPILCGWLKKQCSSRYKKWKRRWCVLTSENLVYYKEHPQKGGTPSKSIQILFAMAKELPPKHEKDQMCYPFEVLTANRTFVFQVPTLEEQEAWVDTIKQQNAKLMNSRLQNTLKGRRKSVASLLLKSGSVIDIKRIPESEPLSKEGRVQLLLSVVNSAGNNFCADCGASDPQWASINLGITLCIQCAGVHRGLGAHRSKVRSIILDDWEVPDIKFLRQVGNERANNMRLPYMPADMVKLTENDDVRARDTYINFKYCQITLPPEALMKLAEEAEQSNATNGPSPLHSQLHSPKSSSQASISQTSNSTTDSATEPVPVQPTSNHTGGGDLSSSSSKHHNSSHHSSGDEKDSKKKKKTSSHMHNSGGSSKHKALGRKYSMTVSSPSTTRKD